jgi:dipeptidyl aminopeptidase/acylaminoacyl peptidase
LRGILERLGALTYRFRVALLRDWLAERLDLQQVARTTRWKMEPAPPLGGRQVSMLAPTRDRQPAPAAREEEPQEGTQAARATVRRRGWAWMAPAAVAGLALVALLGTGLLRGGLGGTPTATSEATTTALPVVATHTGSVATTGRTTLPAVLSTATPEPLPTGTPTPTPPIVLAHPIPAIAYQSRARGESTWSLFVMDSNGGNRTLVTAAQAGFLSPPSWSPDGSRLVVVSDRTGSTDIWMVDLDGSNAVNLTQDEAKDHSPAWSPDGQWIVFASLRDSLYWELYIMGADGSDVQRLTWWEDASDLSPSWSPDGSRIAFASKRDGNWEIYTMDRDGGNLLRVTDHPADDTNPAWSPDGSRIAFESTREGYAEIYLVPVSGGEPVNLSNAPYSSEHGPTWSPDGSRIAFYSDLDGEWDIYAMASDGSDVVKLTGDNTNDQVPAWRP